MIVTTPKVSEETFEGISVYPDLRGYEYNSWVKLEETESTMTVKLFN